MYAGPLKNRFFSIFNFTKNEPTTAGILCSIPRFYVLIIFLHQKDPLVSKTLWPWLILS